MLSEVMKRIESQLAKELPFVIYRKPKSKKIQAILQKDDVIHYVRDYRERGFVFAPFDSDAPAVLLPLDEELVVGISKESEPLKTKGKLTKVPSHGKAIHLKMVQKGIQQISNGSFDKVVLSRKSEVDCVSPPLELFERLVNNYETAFCYLWYHPKIGMWLGATPEILLRTENNRLTTMSLAGTTTKVDDELPTWGQKELDEQRMVTEYITKALEHKVAQLKVADVETIQAGNLWHLRTKITAVYQENLLNIIKALHPTPAVCGMPLVPAREFIKENEYYDREYYTGFLGELNLKQEIPRAKNNGNQENRSYRIIKTATELFVNLRCMKLTKSKATIFVGGGITEDSDPVMEWKETVAKSSTILSVIGAKEYL